MSPQQPLPPVRTPCNVCTMSSVSRRVRGASAAPARAPAPAPTKAEAAPAAPAAPPPAWLPLAISLLAVPIMFALNRWRSLHDSPVLLAVVGAGVCVGAVGAIATLAPRQPALYYAMVLFAFTSVVDGVLSASAYGLTDWGSFYLEGGEAYLRASHGALINAWDATAHLAFYLAAAAALAAGRARTQAHAAATLAWAGSVLNSLAVLLPAIVLGRYGPEVKPSVLLNVPYVALPAGLALAAAASLAGDGGAAPSKAAPSSAAGPIRRLLSGAGSTSDAVDTVLALSAGGVAAGWVFRALAALGATAPGIAGYAAAYEPYLLDTTKYPLAQALAFAYYGAPALLYLAAAVGRGGARAAAASPPALALALFLAGAAAQGQWAYMGGWLIECGASCGPADGWTRPTWSGTPFWTALAINAATAVVPVALAARLWSARSAE
jgi:hypothetical protein